MANRHLLRSLVLQTLFEWDFRSGENVDPLDILDTNIREFAPDVTDASFAVDIIKGIADKKAALDEIISKAAPDWPIDRISVVDRNILREGLYELVFSDHDDVPPKVAINEAIELAKSFGGDTSSKFVNGVLGAVYKEMGEPGKEETSKNNAIPYEELPIEQLAGAVVYAEHEGEIYFALVHDIFGHWTLSKGHLEEGEEFADGVKRIVNHELGLAVSVEDTLGENEYAANNPEKKKIRKHVAYFLARAEFGDMTLKEGGGLDDAKWFKMKDIVDLNFYEDMIPIVTEAVRLLLERGPGTKGGTETS